MGLKDPSVPTAIVAGRSYAIFVGIDEYRNGIPRLKNAVRDVNLLAEVLQSEHGYAVRRVLNEQASLSGLRQLLSELPDELTEEDRLVFYFAGHGVAEEGETESDGPQGFLIPSDAQRDELATFLPMLAVQAQLSRLRCRHLLIFLDCCFAGAFRWSSTRSLAVRPTTLYRERYERYLRDPSWQVITSAAQDERALDSVAGGRLGLRGSDEGNSPFAAALCRALRGAADLRMDGQPGDGVIVATELHLYLESAFERLEQQLNRTVQKPLLWSLGGRDKGQFIFFVPGRAPVLPSALDLNEQNNPYRGLEAYEEKNAGLFFGRAEATAQLYERVQSQQLTVVSGISGSGKSSLVRAGLLTKLRETPGWQIAPPLRPGNRPLSALASICEFLEAPGEQGVASAVASWCRRRSDLRLLIVIDQMEELITLGASENEQRHFLQSIQEALAAAQGRLYVVMTLRSDFEPHFAELLASEGNVQIRFQARPLTRLELREVIEGPASERVLYFEPATLVDRLIDEVAEMPGALPLLSFTLSEMYHAYVKSGRMDRSLSENDYRALGGVEGALSQRASEIYQGLDPSQQDTLRRLMLRMVTLEAGEAARRRLPLSELQYGAGHPEEARIQAVLRQLLKARLLVSGRDHEGAPYVEPAHDKLILGWPQLWTFIKAEQEALPLQRRVTEAALDWDRGQKQPDRLWARDPRLPQVLALGNSSLRFNRLEWEFVTRSERRRRRNRATLLAAGGLIMVALFVWVLRERARANQEKSYSQQIRRELDVSNSLRLTEAARQLLDTAPETALLLATEAAASNYTFASDRALRRALARNPWQARVLGKTLDGGVRNDEFTSVECADVSSDGRHFVTAGYDFIEGQQNAFLWSAQGELIARTALGKHKGGHLEFAKFSKDGRYVLIIPKSGGGYIWRPASGSVAILEPDLLDQNEYGHEWRVAFAISRSGRYIATVFANIAKIWNERGEFQFRVPGTTHDVAFDDKDVLASLHYSNVQFWELQDREWKPSTSWKRIEHDQSFGIFDHNGIQIQSSELILYHLEGLEVFNNRGELVWSLPDNHSEKSLLDLSPDGLTFLRATIAQFRTRIFIYHANRIFPSLLPADPALDISLKYGRLLSDKRILTGDGDGAARIWSSNGDLLSTLYASSEAIHALASSDETQILTAPMTDINATDTRVDRESYHLGPSEHHARLWTRPASEVRYPSFRIDTKWESIEQRIDRVQWDIEHNQMAVLIGAREAQRLVISELNGRQRTIFDLDQPTRMKEPVAIQNGMKLETLKDYLWSPDGQRLVILSQVMARRIGPPPSALEESSETTIARLLDVQTGTASIMRACVGALCERQADEVFSVNFTLDSKYVGLVRRNGTVDIWSRDAKFVASILLPPNTYLNQVAFSVEGKHVLLDDDKKVLVWNLDGRSGLKAEPFKQSYFNYDKNSLVADDELFTYNLDFSGKQLAVISNAEIGGAELVYFNPVDGRILLKRKDKITILNSKGQLKFTCLVTKDSEDPNGALRVSPNWDRIYYKGSMCNVRDGQQERLPCCLTLANRQLDTVVLETPSRDGLAPTAYLWDRAGLHEVLEWDGWMLKLSSDDKYLYTDKTNNDRKTSQVIHAIRVWDHTGHPVRYEDGDPEGIIAFAFAPDQDALVTVGISGQVSVQPLKPEEVLLEAACRIRRDFIIEEINAYHIQRPTLLHKLQERCPPWSSPLKL